MKKILLRVGIALVALIIVAVVVLALSLDRIVKTAIERVGSKVTGTEVKVESVGLSVFSGKGSVKEFVVGNPAGFKSPWAMKLGKASLALQPGSVMADKVIIHSINLEGPEVTLDFNMNPLDNNLRKILSNVQGLKESGQVASTSPGAPTHPDQAPPAQTEAKAARKLQVDEFVITGAKVHVNSPLVGGDQAQALPDIHLRDLGKGPEGITAADLAEKVLAALQSAATQAAVGTVADITKNGLPKDLKQAGTNALDKVSKGLGGFLNR
jgi:uncharacterized protein involved in outer membrane biogenesis